MRKWIMDNSDVLVALLLGVMLCVAALLDIVLAFKGEPTNTISALIMRVSRNYPVLPFAVGVLMGHLFWATFPATSIPPKINGANSGEVTKPLVTGEK